MVNSLGHNGNFFSSLKANVGLKGGVIQPEMFKDIAPEKSADFTPQETRNKGFVIFERTVTRHVEVSLHFSSEGKLQASLEGKIREMVPESEVDQGREERSDKASITILGFIEAQLKRDLADGASEEELASRLDAALEGFEKGFAEAQEILEGFNMLNPYVADDIAMTYDKVTEGIQGFREQYLGEEPVDKPDTTAVPAAEVGNSEVGEVSGAAVAGRLDMSQAREFSFQVRTQDGDLVTINAAGNRSFSAEGVVSTATDGESSASAASFSQSVTQGSTFSFTVEGELDEGELAAINDLLHGVNDLADEFYGGDAATAFAQAQELGYNNDEIAGFALRLSQTVTSRAAVAYQEQSGGVSENSLPERMKPLGDFAQQVLDALKPANEFADPISLFEGIAERIETVRAELLGLNGPDGRFSAFAKVILGYSVQS